MRHSRYLDKLLACQFLKRILERWGSLFLVSMMRTPVALFLDPGKQIIRRAL